MQFLSKYLVTSKNTTWLTWGFLWHSTTRTSKYHQLSLFLILTIPLWSTLLLWWQLQTIHSHFCSSLKIINYSVNTNQDWKFVKLARIHYFKEKTDASAASKSSMLSFEVSRTGVQITEITFTSKNRNTQTFWFQTYHILLINLFIVYLKTNVTNVKHHELHISHLPHLA